MTMKKIYLPLLAGVLTAAYSTLAAEPAAPQLPPPSTKQGVTYAKDIRPLFEASCFRCHTGDRARAGLQLDSLENVLQGSQNGKVVSAGDSAKSRLVITVAGTHPRGGRQGRGRGGAGSSTNSPSTNAPGAAVSGSGTNSSPAGSPGGRGPAPQGLTPEQVGLVRAWIDQGPK
jgi:hypothetical protein